MDRMLLSGMVFAALCVVFSVSVAEGPALKVPVPAPVKPAQPATAPVTTVPSQPAAKSPATPTTPVIGKKPGTGPAGRIGVTKALVSTLRANNSAGPVTVALNGTANVSWDLSSAPNASGVHLLVHTSSLANVICNAPPATSSPDSGKYTTSPRALTLGNAYYYNRQTYYIKGCLFNRTTDPFGLVTDTYTGDWTNQVVVTIGGTRPDFSVIKAIVSVREPFYKVGRDWFEKDLDAITSFPQWQEPNSTAYSAEIGLSNTNEASGIMIGVTLNLNGRKYRITFPETDRNPKGVVFRDVPIDNLWRDYLLGRNIKGTVIVDEEGSVEESDEGNNSSRDMRVEVLRIRPTNLQVSRTGAGLQLQWLPTQTSRLHGSHIVARYALGPNLGILNRKIYNKFTVGPSTSSFTIPSLPWGEMVDNRACFRVVASTPSDSPAYELVSAPSNEVCFVVRDRRN